MSGKRLKRSVSPVTISVGLLFSGQSLAANWSVQDIAPGSNIMNAERSLKQADHNINIRDARMMLTSSTATTPVLFFGFAANSMGSDSTRNELFVVNNLASANTVAAVRREINFGPQSTPMLSTLEASLRQKF